MCCVPYVLLSATTNGREEVTLKGIERQGIFAAVVMYLARMGVFGEVVCAQCGIVTGTSVHGLTVGHIFIDPLAIQHRWDFDPRVIPV